ncbi:MAG TPA: D-alanyl-D-alanine carboxypeptidase [Actinomycetota bacterium]|nr:D-alanyl-D-alanine carboxypeptidase [Actinomycetota bacterium]
MGASLTPADRSGREIGWAGGSVLNRNARRWPGVSFVLATTLALLSAGATRVPAAAAETATLTASDKLMTAGDQIVLSGAVSGDPGCLPGRTAQLMFRVPDPLAWVLVASGTTASDGSYTFTDGQMTSGRYHVELPIDDTCPPVVSQEVEVKVRARVDSTLLATSLVAGSCVSIDVMVAPDKPGQVVELQRKTGGSWASVEELTLDETSSASTRPCFGWEDIGIVRLRAAWPMQDQFNEPGVGIELAFEIEQASWMDKIDDAIGRRAVSVSVGDDGLTGYEHRDAMLRIPASNEKLLLSMALLDSVGAEYRIPTIASARELDGKGIVQGNLWLIGRGDPTVGPGRLRALARQIRSAGVTKVTGRVIGSTTYFRRDWWADGWRRGITRDYVGLPTALTYRGNVVRGHEIRDAERRAAASLTGQLKRLGIRVGGKPGMGQAPGDAFEVAHVLSRPLASILSLMNRPSDNFYAEVLGKLLGVKTSGAPGTIAKGAAAIEAFAGSHGVTIETHDSSGLSYENRVTANGIVRLLWAVNDEPWANALRSALPSGGQGTLARRLRDVKVRAKTGSLDGVSALSGWVWLEKERSWGEFSILCTAMTKADAVAIEDKVVRILANQARI